MRFFPIVITSLLMFSACGSKSDSNSGASASSANAVESEQKVFYATMVWDEPLKAGTKDQKGTLAFTDSHMVAASSVTVNGFRLLMPSMGHGSYDGDQKYTAVEGSPDKVRVEGVYFTMGGAPGEWVVDVTATVNGTEDKVRLELPEVQ